MQLIIFTGLPGSGKSSIAEAAACELGISVFAKDWLEATLTLTNRMRYDVITFGS